MYVNNPTYGILSDSMAEVLRALQRMTPGRTGRVIAASCEGVSVAQVNVILRRFEEIGLVTTHSVPPAKQYFLNREHVLCTPLLDLINAKAQLIDWLTDRLTKTDGIISAILFGSVARGEDTPGSDVDLLLVFSGDKALEGSSGQLQLIEDEFLKRFGNALGITKLSKSDIVASFDQQPAFLTNVIHQGRLLLGQELEQILGRKVIEGRSGATSAEGSGVS